jgi:hypothetical protein
MHRKMLKDRVEPDWHHLANNIAIVIQNECYGSTRTVYVDFVSRLLLWRVTCLLTFFVTAINMNTES